MGQAGAPFFSVVMATYNRRDLCSAALNSVLAQRFRDFEVIVVDDGSTDGTWERLGDFGEAIRAIRQNNQGPASARNNALAHARGEYVAFLDSDDLWFPWTLHAYHEALQSHGWPAGLHAASKHFRQEVDLANVTEGPLIAEYHRDQLAVGRRLAFYGMSWWVAKTEVLRSAGGFSTDFYNVEDVDYRLRVATAPGFVVVKAPITLAYREHDGNLVHQQEKTWTGIELICEREAAGRYAGGEGRRRDRQDILCSMARANLLIMARAGHVRRGWAWYWRTFGWQLRLGRVSFLVGAPGVLLYHGFRHALQSRRH